MKKTFGEPAAIKTHLAVIYEFNKQAPIVLFEQKKANKSAVLSMNPRAQVFEVVVNTKGFSPDGGEWVASPGLVQDEFARAVHWMSIHHLVLMNQDPEDTTQLKHPIEIFNLNEQVVLGAKARRPLVLDSAMAVAAQTSERLLVVLII